MKKAGGNFVSGILAAILIGGFGCGMSPGGSNGGCGAPSASTDTATTKNGSATAGKTDPNIFSNGDRISHADGTPISPGSPEGQKIEAILGQQRQTAADNAAQKALFWRMTNSPNAASAHQIPKDAQQKDPNAGTPNVIQNIGQTGNGASSP